MRPEQVINGSYGEIWLDTEYCGDVTAFEATIEIEYEDIKTPRKLGVGKKMTGYTGSGTVSFNKINSRFIKLVGEKLRNGQQVSVTIISKLDDPDALGAERIAIKDATFTNLTLANWEAAAAGKQEAPFNFSEWEPLDLI